MRTPYRLLIAAVLALHACQASPQALSAAAGPVAHKERPTRAASATPTRGATHPTLPAGALTRVVPQVGPTTQLIGKVKLLSDQGAGIISNNGGVLVSNQGGGIVSNGGAGLGPARSLLQAPTPRPEALLAEADVLVTDGEGRVLVDERGNPLGARSDGQGGFRIDAVLPSATLVLRVPLWTGGELAALAVPQATGAWEVPIDTAATLGATYVLGPLLKDVQARQAALDRLQGRAEVGQLRLALDAARASLTKAPAYRPEQLVALTDALRAEQPALAASFEAVRRVMTLAGVDGCLREGDAEGRAALQQPIALALGPDGSTYVVERFTGIVRRLDPAGRVTNVVGPCSPTEGSLGSLYLGELTRLGDTLFALSLAADTVYRLAPDGRQVEPVLGGGKLPAAAGLGPRAVRLVDATALAAGRNGTLLVADSGSQQEGLPGRIVRWSPEGGLLGVTPGPFGETPMVQDLDALAEGPDGALWVLSGEGTLWRQAPGGAPWRLIAQGLAASALSGLLALPDGAVIASVGRPGTADGHQVLRVTAEGQVTTLAGAGPRGLDPGPTPAATARFSVPSGLALRADGAVLVADTQNGLVRAILPDGTVTVAQGSVSQPQALARNAILNLPFGVAVDASGRVTLTEAGAGTLRRLEGETLALLTSRQGTPRLGAPRALVAAGEAFYVVDGDGTARLCKVHADGRVEVLAGDGATVLTQPPAPGGRPIARDLSFRDIGGVTVDREGRPVFATDCGTAVGATSGVVWRLEADGTLTWLAGSFAPLQTGASSEADRPAREVALGDIAALCHDPAGNLYLAEPGATRILRLDAAGLLSVHAGVPLAQTLVRTLDGSAGAEQDVPAREASLLLPLGLACDAQGVLYVAELGTRAAQLHANQALGGLVELPPLDGRLRKITPEGRAVTLAGLGAKDRADAVRNPISVAVAPDGQVYFIDAGTAQLKALEEGPR
ncbi:MAG: hypothetical protein VKS61_11335 [Candidatus Sericytochromatia bacterium]|nr:hypothetical protein [Candidatus Sericytochromatia bacterium]